MKTTGDPGTTLYVIFTEFVQKFGMISASDHPIISEYSVRKDSLYKRHALVLQLCAVSLNFPL
jgi:hypothetical protein